MTGLRRIPGWRRSTLNPPPCDGDPLPISATVKADLLLVIVTLLAAAGWMFSKEALQGLPPLLFIGVRFFLAGCVLAAAGWASLARLRKPDWRKAILGGVVFASAMGCWIHGLYLGKHVGEGAFITSLGVVLVPLVARVLFKDQLPRILWLSLPIAVSGFACLSLEQGFRLEVGQLFFLAAAVLFAVHFNLVTRFVAGIPAVALTAIQLITVGVLTFTASLLLEQWPSQIALSIWWWVLASALIASSLRFFLQTYAQSLTPASHAAMIMTIEPVWTALLAGLWLDEGMSTLQLIGCTLIFAALLVNRWLWVVGLWRSSLRLYRRKSD